MLGQSILQDSVMLDKGTLLDEEKLCVERFSESDFSNNNPKPESDIADVDHQNNSSDETDFVSQPQQISCPLNGLSTGNDVPKILSKDLRKEKLTCMTALFPLAQQASIQNDQTSASFSMDTFVINEQKLHVHANYLDRHALKQHFTATTGHFGTYTHSFSTEKIFSLSLDTTVWQFNSPTIPHYYAISYSHYDAHTPLMLEANSCNSGRKGKRVRAKRSSNSSNSQHASSNNSASTFTGGKSVSGSGCGGGGDDDKDKKEQKKIPRPPPPGTHKFRAWMRKKQKKTRKLSTSKSVKPHVIPVDEKDDTQLQSTSRPPNKETSLVKDNWPQAQQSSHPFHGSLVPPSTQHHTHNHKHKSLERKQFEVLIPPTIKATNIATKPVSSKLPKNSQNEQGINNRRQSSALILPGLSYAQVVVKGVPLEVTVHPKEPPLNTTDKVGAIMVTGALETSANGDPKVPPPPSTSGTYDTGHQQPVCPLCNDLQERYSILPADHHDLLVYAVPRYKEFECLAGNAQDPPLHVNPIPPVPDDTLPVEIDIAIPIEGEDVLAVNFLLGPPPAHFPDIELDNEQQGQQAGIIHHQLHVMAGGVQPVEGGNPGSVAYTQSGIGKYC